jgi:DNA repair exonuclease SbcCD nuclease subunit
MKFIGSDKQIAPMPELGMPIVAIHGTHERKAKGQMNVIEAVEKAGFLIYLHCNGIELEKGQEKICVYGLSGVPDQYADSVLKNWNPKPEPSCFNIFMIHQSISQFLYAPHAIDLNVLPKGFDLYICGHMHDAKKSLYDGKPFLIPGSPIITQVNKESVNARGFWTLEIESEKIKSTDFVKIENQRKVYYLEFDNEEKIIPMMEDLFRKNFEKKPLVKIVAPGIKETLANEIKIRFGQRSIISFKKDLPEKVQVAVKTLEEHKFSVQEAGRKLLRENLENKKLDPQVFENIFELLENGEEEKALQILRDKSKA